MPKPTLSVSPMFGPADTIASVEVVGVEPNMYYRLRWDNGTQLKVNGTESVRCLSDIKGGFRATVVIPKGGCINPHYISVWAEDTMYPAGTFKAQAEFTMTYPDRIFNRTVTWADGSTETWKIDEWKRVYVNGIAKNLIGFTNPYAGLEPECGGPPYGLDVAISEMDWFGSQGVRVLRILYWNWWGHEKLAKLMDAAYRNKLMVLFSISPWDEYRSRNPPAYFYPTTEDDWIENFVESTLMYIHSNPNWRQIILTIILENEFNQYWWQNPDTPETDFVSYCQWLSNIARRIFTDTPMSITVNGPGGPKVMKAIGRVVDIACIQAYGDDIGPKYGPGLGFAIHRAKGGYFAGEYFSGIINETQHWFMTETGPDYSNHDARYYRPNLAECSFSVNASIILAWSMNRYGDATGFFNDDGTPIASAKNLVYYGRDITGTPTPYVYNIYPFKSVMLSSINFDSSTKTLNCIFNSSSSTSTSISICVPNSLYPDGFSITADVPFTKKWDSLRQILTIEATLTSSMNLTLTPS